MNERNEIIKAFTANVDISNSFWALWPWSIKFIDPDGFNIYIRSRENPNGLVRKVQMVTKVRQPWNHVGKPCILLNKARNLSLIPGSGNNFLLKHLNRMIHYKQEFWVFHSHFCKLYICRIISNLHLPYIFSVLWLFIDLGNDYK